MEGKPIWLTEDLALHPQLRGRQQAEAVVVGGGLSGVTTAYMLAREGMHVVLLEADRLGRGASGHSMGKVTVQHGLIYSRLKEQWGMEVTQAYAFCQSRALKAMASLAIELEIPCGWNTTDASLYAQTAQEERLLEKEEAAAQKAGLSMSLMPASSVPMQARSILTVSGQASFDPFAYLHSLTSALLILGSRIYEQSRVQSISTQGVYTDTGSVHAPFVIIATHFPIINFPGWYFLRARQIRSHVVALSDAPALEGMYQHVNIGGISVVRRDGLLLMGALAYPTGQETSIDHDTVLLKKAHSLYPNARPYAFWHGQDVMSTDGLPFIGPYSQRTPNHFVAAGFSNWGMTNSMAAAQAISSRILGQLLPEAEIFDPSRTMKYSASKMMSTFLKTTGIHISGIKRKQAPTCTHMGCKLRYNPSTASWDCPCHGSRFDSIGRILNGPAVHQAAITNKNRLGQSK